MNSSSLYENKIKWGDAFIILYDVNDYTSFEEVTRKLASKVTSGHFLTYFYRGYHIRMYKLVIGLTTLKCNNWF